MKRKTNYEFNLTWREFKAQFNAALDCELWTDDATRIRVAQKLKAAINALNEATNLRQSLVNKLNDVSELQAGIANYLLRSKQKSGRDCVLEVLVESCRKKWFELLWFFDSVVLGLNTQERGILRRILEGIVGQTPVIDRRSETA